METGVLVSTPDLRPSLFSVLSGLRNNDLLGLLVTTIARKESSSIFSGLVRTAMPDSILGPWLRRTLPDDLVEKTRTIPGRELLRLLASKVTTPEIAHDIWSWSEKGFDKTVARRYAGQFSLVYGMEHSSLDTFLAQKEAGGYCLLRQVNAHGRFIMTVMCNEISRFPEFATSYVKKVSRDYEQVLARKEEEYIAADFIVGNSDFVRSSFLQYGFDEENVFAVPTGCPPISPVPAEPGRGETLRFLYVGTVGLRKGFQYLLTAWRSMGGAKKVELHVAGTNEFPADVLVDNQLRIHYHGKVNKRDIAELYRRCDVLVLPTLCEGLAHSVLEAMSSGMPVITTEESGCAGFLVDGENGFIVQAADAGALRSALEWCVANKRDLFGMGQCSLDRARRWTVDDSNDRHLQVIKEIFESRILRKRQHQMNI